MDVNGFKSSLRVVHWCSLTVWIIAGFTEASTSPVRLGSRRAKASHQPLREDPGSDSPPRSLASTLGMSEYRCSLPRCFANVAGLPVSVFSGGTWVTRNNRSVASQSLR